MFSCMLTASVGKTYRTLHLVILPRWRVGWQIERYSTAPHSGGRYVAWLGPFKLALYW